MRSVFLMGSKSETFYLAGVWDLPISSFISINALSISLYNLWISKYHLWIYINVFFHI